MFRLAFIFLIIAFLIASISDASECTGSGTLQKLPVSLWNAQIGPCMAQGLTCFSAYAANNGFRKSLTSVMRLSNRRDGQADLVVLESNFAQAGTKGSYSYDRNSGSYSISLVNELGDPYASFSFKCD